MQKLPAVVMIFNLLVGVCWLRPPQVSAAVSAEHTVIRGANGVLYVSTELQSAPTIPAAQSGSRKNSETATTSAKQVFVANNTATRSANIVPITMPDGFFTSVTTLFNGLLRIVFLVATLLTFFYLLRSGFGWITSGGDRGKLESARNGIIAAVLGLIIVSASYAVLTLVIQFLGFESLNQLLEQGLAR